MCHSVAASDGCYRGPICYALPTKPAEISTVEDLFDFICSGPLIEKMGLSSQNVVDSIDKWLAYGSYLCRLFKFNEMELTIPQKARFYHYYIPVFLWCEDQISQHYSMFKEGEEIPPLVVSFWNFHMFVLLISNLLLITILCPSMDIYTRGILIMLASTIKP